MGKAHLIFQFLKKALNQPRRLFNESKNFTWQHSARDFAKKYREQTAPTDRNYTSPEDDNPLLTYFHQHTNGNGIWKWEHYFDIYHRHFRKFRKQPVKILEIGIYSGGSLDMWLDYFGDQCQVYGVDIEAACKSYAKDRVAVFIGDQEDPAFWQKVFKETGPVDIVIDDGGHLPTQQRASLEAILPMISPGGIYLCEDIATASNPFGTYAGGLMQELNHQKFSADNARVVKASTWQAAVKGIYCYPYVLVLEKNEALVSTLQCPKRGTQWQPFFKDNTDKMASS